VIVERPNSSGNVRDGSAERNPEQPVARDGL